LDSGSRRPTRLLIGTLGLVLGCSNAHDLSAEQGMGGRGRNEDDGSVPNRNAVQPGNICRRLAEIQCAAERSCCDDPQRDMSSCLDEVETSCAVDALVDRIAAVPETGFDPAQAEAVLDELERLASDCDPGIWMFGESRAGLLSIFAGSVESGGSCRPANVLDETQAAAALVACGDAERQACLPSLGAWRCAPIAAEAGACFTEANCEAGLYCTNTSLNLAGGQCAARRETGADCAFDQECQSSFCVMGACVQAERDVVYCPR
jgi:hypothetical protein